MIRFRFLVALLGIFAMGITVVPYAAHAQFSKGYDFLKAVKERDGAKTTTLLDQPGSTLINTRDLTSGETALHIVVARRDTNWVAFLLKRGANPDAQDNKKMTPLLLAVRYRDTDIADLLLRHNADVNQANSAGETPIIVAVQLNDLAMVRLLLKKGADADQTDNIAGKSALDYAMEGRRRQAILEAIQNADKNSKEENIQIFGPTL